MDKKYFESKYGKETIDDWINTVAIEELMDCMSAFSNASFNGDSEWKLHRNKELNILEMILQETPNGLYPSVTYGARPNEVCTDAIGYLTGKKYGNIDVAMFLIEENIQELKKWLLENYEFSIQEETLLHFFKDRKGVIYRH